MDKVHNPNVVTTVISNGVPHDYDRTSSNARRFGVVKGAFNQFVLRPRITSEHQTCADVIQGTVTSSSKIVGQIFKASRDNINGFIAAAESASSNTLDSFDTYANDAELQAAWVANAARLATLSTEHKSSPKSMEVPTTINNDTWTKTITATDFTGRTFSFWFQQSESFGEMIISFFIGDGVNTKSINIPVENAGSWQRFQYIESALIDDGGVTPDIENITKIGYKVVLKKQGSTAIIDSLVDLAPAGKIKLRLWDCGKTLPESGSFTLNTDAIQYTELGDRGSNGGTTYDSVEHVLANDGFSKFPVQNFIAGVSKEHPSNILITIGNYYAVTLEYVDSDIAFYGCDPAIQQSRGEQAYNNGYAFTAADESTPIVTIGEYSCLMFFVNSTQSVYVNQVNKAFNAAPGEKASEAIYTLNKNDKLEEVPVGIVPPQQAIQAEFNSRPFLITDGGRFVINYQSDIDEDVTSMDILIGYYYKKMPING
jgi:hypothetical protein